MIEPAPHALDSNPDRRPPKVGKAAIAAARLAVQLTGRARERQRAGKKAADGTRGKSAQVAAAQFGVSTRAVEQGLLLLRSGRAQVVASVCAWPSGRRGSS
jgi:hypothetical protein